MIHALVSFALLASPSLAADKKPQTTTAKTAKTQAATSGAKPAPTASPTPGAAHPDAQGNTGLDANAPAAEAPKPAPVEPKPHAEPKQAAEEERPSDYYGKYGLLYPVKLGPSVSIIGFPHPLEIGAHAKAWNLVGIGYAYGLIPKITVSGYSVKMHATQLELKVFPFRGAFYVGAGLLGKQTVTVNATRNITASGITVPVTGTAELKNDFITPQLGWRWEFKWGLFFGIDLGWQINSNAKTTIVTDQDNNATVNGNSEYQKLKTDLQNKGNDYGNTGLPSFTLLQVGFYL